MSQTHTPAHPTAHAHGNGSAEPSHDHNPNRHDGSLPVERGVEQLRHSPMMARLLDDLHKGTDIGHYGRLTYAMVARFFVDPEDIVRVLAKQPDQTEAKVEAMVAQVVDRGYSPPRRERILQWQSKQEYQMIADIENPDDGNLYRDLEFPDDLYDHIAEYHEEQVVAHHHDDDHAHAAAR